jgi:hypothetical protein
MTLSSKPNMLFPNWHSNNIDLSSKDYLWGHIWLMLLWPHGIMVIHVFQFHKLCVIEMVTPLSNPKVFTIMQNHS